MANRTVTGCDAGAESVTGKVKAVQPLLPSARVALPIESVGAGGASPGRVATRSVQPVSVPPIAFVIESQTSRVRVK